MEIRKKRNHLQEINTQEDNCEGLFTAYVSQQGEQEALDKFRRVALVAGRIRFV